MGIILFLIFGLGAGLLARALMRDGQKIGITMTALLGCAGALLGGFLGNLIAGHQIQGLTSAGFIGSLVGALVILLVLSPMMSRSRRHPAA